jgi:signal transduction histidine kinase/ligand-binding sensor domain-containing protein/CheY-like chemotaxis protein
MVLLCVHAHAIERPVRLAPSGIQPAFDNFDTRRGLPNSEVIEVVADRYGFLWIAGNRGVQRFDGHTFFQLDRDPDRPDTLESRYVYGLAECGDAMWIGAPNGHVQRLDYATGKLALFPMRYGGASPQGMLWIACDGLGQLWQMSDLGLLRLDRRGGLTRALPRSFDAMAFDPARTRMFLATPAHRVVAIDVRDPTRVSTVLALPPGVDNPVAMAVDATGLWLAIDRDLWRFDFANKALHRVPMPVPMFRITFITPAPDGALWLASWRDPGLYRFDPRERLLSVHRHDPADPRSLPDGTTSAMALDRSNNLWIGKHEFGLARLNLGQTALTRYRPDAGGTIYGMAETTQGRLMVSPLRGAPMELDRRLGQFVPLPGSAALPVHPRAMVGDRAGGLWITTSLEGLFHWRPDGTVRHFVLPRTQGQELAMTGVYLDDRDRVWVSHHLGLAVLEPGATALRNVEAYEGKQRFVFDFTQDVSPGPGGTLWVATMNGLLHYDPATQQVRRLRHDRADRRSLSDNYLLQTHTDHGGRLWIATRAGLNRLVRDRRGGIAFRRYGVADGLPDITIPSVLSDASGGLWVATGRGIARWDPAQDRFQSYLPSDGIPDSDIQARSTLATRDGSLYFAALDGLLRIDPRTLRIAQPAPIVLSSHESGDRNVVNLQGAKLSRIDTQYTEGRLVLHLAVLGDARRLSYRMEGLDDRWQPMPDDLSIAYHWMPPGSYRLQVRQRQRNGTWGAPELSLPIDVAAPWWRTGWAYAVYALALLATLIALVRVFLAWRHRELRAQLKESNTRLSVALHAARFGTWAWDVKAQKAEVDAFTRDLLEIPPGTPAMDELFARMHPDDERRLRVQGDDALRKDGAVDYEFRLPTGAPGEWRWVEGHAAAVRRPGKSAYIFGVNRDATQRKRELTELAEAKETAERAETVARLADEAKGRFLAMMSHEIRTPISGVIGMVELLIDTPLSEDQRRQLSICKDSAYLLLTIINDILDFSKIEAGKLTLEQAPLSPRRLVGAVVESLAPLAARKGIALDVLVAPEVPRRLVGDRVRLGQVLTNLVGNALKFTEAGSVRVEVHAAPTATPDLHEIRFEVIDTGIGMDRDTREHLFQPFHQADATTTRRFGGTGLGLTIVRHLVTLMGGSVACESTAGTGSRFTVLVPLASVDATESMVDVVRPAFVPTHAPEHQAPPGTQAAAILVADDNAMNREVLTRQLERLGHAYAVATDGEQAWAMLQAHPARYRLLLTDCHMPRLDGYALTERIRREEAATGRPRLRIVAITANALQGEGDRCLAMGMDDFLTKPLAIETLDRMVRRLLHPGARAARALADLVGDDEARRQRLFDLYVVETDADLAKWQVACASRDRAQLQALAHKLKSGCRLVGEEAVAASLEALEGYGGSDDELLALAASAQAELEQSLARVDALRRRLRPA